MNVNRCHKLIWDAIATFNLNLSELVVLTEAANGYYALTPLIAALAGAKRVLAITHDSRFGRAVEIQDKVLTLARKWGINDGIEILLSREDERIGQADIVTNLGFVRPIDASFLQLLKPTAVIPLMWETWEYRPEDLDLFECRRLDIPVLGTNEDHPALEIFRYVGYLAMKLLFELDIEILRSKVVIIGGGRFGKHTLQSLQNAGASVTQVRVTEGDSLCSYAVRQAISECDAIVVVEHDAREKLIGQGGQITAKELHKLNQALSIAHIAGGVNREEVKSAGIPCRPDNFALPGYMSVATDYLGPRPLIDLHTAGLKVGEELARARDKFELAVELENFTLQKTKLTQGFRGYHETC